MFPPALDPIKQFEIGDDFHSINTALWTSVDDAATGTNVLVADGTPGGLLNVVSAAADNDYHLMASASKSFKFAAAKPLWFEAQIRLTEANTSAANFVVGVTSVTTTGFMTDNGAGPPASWDGAAFFKVDGGTVLQFETSKGSAQVTNTNIAPFVSGALTRLGFVFNPGDGVTGTITPFVNGIPGTPHKIVLAGLTQMNAVFGVKAGSASAETLAIDYIRVAQAR